MLLSASSWPTKCCFIEFVFLIFVQVFKGPERIRLFLRALVLYRILCPSRHRRKGRAVERSVAHLCRLRELERHESSQLQASSGSLRLLRWSVLASGRLLNLSCSTGQPTFEIPCSFTWPNQSTTFYNSVDLGGWLRGPKGP